MRVLSIGTDASIFKPGSAAGERQRAYAETLGHLEIVVLSKSKERAIQVGALFVYAAVSNSRIGRLFRGYRVARRLARPDVVTTQDPFETGLVGLLVARHFRVPLHVQVHTDFLSPSYSRLSLMNSIRAALAGHVLKRAARARVVSEHIKKSIETRYHLHAPISVLPIFVDVEKFKSAQADAALAHRFASFKTKLLVVARLEPEKNVLLALRAFKVFARDSACLIVIGDGRERAPLESAARSFGISDRIFFEGRQDPAPYYKLADLVLVPSKYEGYGMVVVEALAAGRPVLSTDVGVAHEAGAIITSEPNFAAALSRWFEDGPRGMYLKGYPYKNMSEYVDRIAGDIGATVT